VPERAASDIAGASQDKLTPAPTLPVGSTELESATPGGREAALSSAPSAEPGGAAPVAGGQDRAAPEVEGRAVEEVRPATPETTAAVTVPEVPVEREAEAAPALVEDATQDAAAAPAPPPARVEVESGQPRVEVAPVVAAAREASVVAAPPVEPVPPTISRDPEDRSAAVQDGSLAPSSGPPGAAAAPARSRWLVVAAAGGAALAVAAGVWLTLGRAPLPSPAAAPDAVAVAEPGAVERAVAATQSATAASPAASAPVEPEPAASASSGVPAAAGQEPVRVRILISPPTGRVIEKGKRVGYSGVEVEVMPGKRRIFEIQHDGYTPRRLVVDGSEPEIRIGLRPASDPPAPAVPADTAGAAPTATASPPRMPAAPTPSGLP